MVKVRDIQVRYLYSSSSITSPVVGPYHQKGIEMRQLKTVLAGVCAVFLLTIALAPVMGVALASHQCDDSYPPAPNCEVLGHQQDDDDDDDGDGDVGGTGEELPFTGADITLYALGGVALVGGGTLLVRQTRRSRSDS